MGTRANLFKTPDQAATLKRLAAILVLLVLLPAVFYSAYEITSLSQSENLIQQIYRQQLDAVLFSLNQYSWDIANSWASDINRMLRTLQPAALPRARQELTSFLSSNKGIHSLFVVDTTVSSVLLNFSTPSASARREFQDRDLLHPLQAERQLIARLLRLQETGYRKIEGVSLPGTGGGQSTGLLFIADMAPGRMLVAGIILDAESFIRDVLGPKINEAAGEEFLLAVARKDGGQTVYTTGSIAPGEASQTRDLWLFPDYSLGIRLKGQTIDELVRDRFRRNLILIGILDLVIVAGAWFVYRTVRREMELAQLKSDFVSNVSHELRTPLSLIRMFGETLEMARVSSEEKKKEYYSTIVRETERLSRLINNILSFSRMESGKKEYRLAEVDLNAVVKKVLSTYESHLAHQGFAVQTDVAESLPTILADAEAVSEALLNIIDNAVKYSDEQKSLRITTRAIDKDVYVEVEDRGIGIPPQHLKKIFEKFYRVSTGLAHDSKGSGLGLTLVQHIMEAHKGEVTVKSQPGEGSTFRLSFPVK